MMVANGLTSTPMLARLVPTPIAINTEILRNSPAGYPAALS
jgi:hypothetical protein